MRPSIVQLGYGRTHAGRVGNGPGFDAYPLRFSDALWAGTGAEVHAISGSYPLATMQMNQRMEDRDMVISEPVATYIEDPEFAKKRIEIPEKEETLYPTWEYTGYAWGMSIDLTRLRGLHGLRGGLPGRKQHSRGRKRAVPVPPRNVLAARGRLLRGSPTNTPAMRYQPVPCMHCEDAPCELCVRWPPPTTVPDGLNDMIYNRCIGTRYCSNNCPYKVRRFNFLLFNDWVTEQLKMQRNPGRDGTQPRRHGEVQLLRAAHPRGGDPLHRREPLYPRRRNPDRLPAGLPHAAPSPSATSITRPITWHA